MSAMLTCPKCGSADVQATGEGQYRCAQCAMPLRLHPLADVGAARCPQCRTLILSDALFCYQCGAKVQTLVASRPCPVCERLVPTASSFCSYCGAQISLPESAEHLDERVARRREANGCPRCGQTIEPAYETCPHCGVNIEAFLTPLRQQALNNMPAYDKSYNYNTDLIENPPQPGYRHSRSGQSIQANKTFFYFSLFLALLMLVGLALLMLVIKVMERGM